MTSAFSFFLMACVVLDVSSHEEPRSVSPLAYCNSEFIISDNLPITIKSPNYPARYPSGQRCKWKIRPMQPTARVRVTCTDIDLFGLRLGVALGDFVRVTTESRRRHVAINLDFLHCHNVPFQVEAEPGELVTLEFRSDGILQRRGFLCQASVYKKTQIARQCGIVPKDSSSDIPATSVPPVSSNISLTQTTTVKAQEVTSDVHTLPVEKDKGTMETTTESVSPTSDKVTLATTTVSSVSDGQSAAITDFPRTEAPTQQNYNVPIKNDSALTANVTESDGNNSTHHGGDQSDEHHVQSSDHRPSELSVFSPIAEGDSSHTLEARRKKLRPSNTIASMGGQFDTWKQESIELPPPTPESLEVWQSVSAENSNDKAANQTVHSELEIQQEPTFTDEESFNLIKMIKQYALTAMLRILNQTYINTESNSPEMDDVPGNDGVVCGGSLISKRYVLTAAHCVEKADSVRALIGYHHLDHPSAHSIQVGASEKIVHQSWNVRTVEHDIALLRLEKNVTFNDHIQPICLPSRSQIGETFAGARGTVIGWGGYGEVPELSKALRYASDVIMTNCRCQMRWMHLVTPLKMCLNGRNSFSPCGGDSGGILQVTSDTGHALQVGIISWGTSLGCDAGWPSGHTRITGYLDWIEENSDVIIAN